MDRSRTWTITLAATLSVVLLLVMTDFTPIVVDDFRAMPAEPSRIEAVCILSSFRNASNGLMLDLQDSSGDILKAYLDTRQVTFVPVNGSYVKVTGTYQPGASPILFIDSISRLDRDKFINRTTPDHLEVALCT